MHHSRVAAMQYHCCVVDWQCRARALTLPRTKLNPPVELQSIHAQNQYTTNSQGDLHAALEHQIKWRYYGLGEALTTVSIQGSWSVHDVRFA